MWLNDIRNSFPRNRWSNRLSDRIALSHDAGFYSLIPKVIVHPETTDDLVRLFQIAGTHSLPVTIRAAGTSLSGQASGTGILADISGGWKSVTYHSDTRTVTVGPGVIAHHVNLKLKPFGRKIGPDPASAQAAMMGGVLANNASGMCCGVAHNSYHSLVRLKAVLPDGFRFDSDSDAFHPVFPALLDIQNRILADPVLVDKIRQSFLLKNTLGYSLNAFLDARRPQDILARLFIGSEGTLGFISEATLKTLPDLPEKLTALLLFPDPATACRQIGLLTDLGAAAVELMDYRSLCCIRPFSGSFRDLLSDLPAGTTALLTEWEVGSPEELNRLNEKIRAALKKLPVSREAVLVTFPDDRAELWKLRKGLFPTVGSARRKGTTVIIEDVAVPVDRLAEAVEDLEKLFQTYSYSEAIQFGHAKDGNLHFVITQSFSSSEETDRYRRLMDDVTRLVSRKFGGSLKAEHGTGRNMAPFLELAWGPEAAGIMREIKKLLDPAGILNPDVLISSDPEIHLKNLKQLPETDPETDACMECGFCEPVCPSRNLTLTPRQRIVIRRFTKQLPEADAGELTEDFVYGGIETCAADGLCAVACPVGIDTGKLMKRLRTEAASGPAQKATGLLARNFKLAETGTQAAAAARPFVNLVAEAVNFYRPGSLPKLPVNLKPAVKLPAETRDDADAVYFQSCISRTMGGYPDEKSLGGIIEEVCLRAGVILSVPDTRGSCCGTPFSSKGYPDAASAVFAETINRLYHFTHSGKIPVLVDTSPCTQTFLNPGFPMSPETENQYTCLTFLDSVTFLARTVLPRLTVFRKVESAWFHPACSVVKAGLLPDLIAIAGQTCHDGRFPEPSGCCGMAGDRGLWHPELPENAMEKEIAQFKENPAARYFSSSRTCESGLDHHSGFPFRSLWHLADEVSRP
ncbi:MAG: FAD-binding oxidoreductase [Bacteroidetes bacterium]|nr:FAD-binding oxidoreductase [Bacteroidota bacterium]